MRASGLFGSMFQVRPLRVASRGIFMRALPIIVGLLLAAAGPGGARAAGLLDYQLVWSDEFDGAGVDPAKWFSVRKEESR